jgi:hypothetical protein
MDRVLAYRLFFVFTAHERCEGNTSFAYVLTEHSSQWSSIRERDLYQLPNRAHCTKMPRSRLAGSPA